jgi:uncharacterized damage-inducible protein DinB
MSELKNPFLAEMLQIANECNKEVIAFQDLSHRQINWRIGPTYWSIGQLLDHIITTDHCFFGGIRSALEEGSSKGITSDKPYRVALLNRAQVKSWGPKTRSKKISPESFMPSSAFIPLKILDDFHVHQAKLFHYIRTADGLHLGKLRVTTTDSRWNFRLGELFNVLLNHQLRHLGQIRRIIEHSSFPTS